MISSAKLKYKRKVRILLICILVVIFSSYGETQPSMITFLRKMASKISGKKEEKAKDNEKFHSDPTEQEMSSLPEDFPDTLEAIGYEFYNDRLRNTETKEPFQFNVSEDHNYNQNHYEALGKAVTNYIYQLMEDKFKLKREFVPIDAPGGEPRSFIFKSENTETADKLLILIHGSGAVRAGQWARRLIINDCLDSGTQLPFIKRGIEEGYGIIVLNPNLNYIEVGGEKVSIRENSCPEEHGIYVWKHFVSKTAAKKIAIVAHSFGGVVTLHLLKKFLDDFISRVFAIAFTDSGHYYNPEYTRYEVRQIINHRAINFVSSEQPVNTQVESLDDCRCVSAGTTQHEMTSWSSFDYVFEFIKDQLGNWQHPSGDEASLPNTFESVVTLKPDNQEKEKQDVCAESEPNCKDEETESSKEVEDPEQKGNDIESKTTSGDAKVTEEKEKKGGNTQSNDLKREENNAKDLNEKTEL